MDVEVYADPAHARLLTDRFVLIRVDADRRPDLADRYALGGLPTTAFLNAQGVLVGGGTFIPAGRFGAVLQRVLDSWDTNAAIIESAVEPEAQADRAVHESGAPQPDLTAIVYASFDEQHGGFGTAPKFPLVAPVRLALDRYAATGSAEDARVAARTLDAMGWGGLFDEVDGGFFRCADGPGWDRPHTEKLLDVNAGLALLYVEAAAVLAAERYLDRAGEILRYVQTWLADPVDGGWGAFQHADPAYYALDADARRAAAPPAVERLLRADASALMVSAALAYARARSDDGVAAFAVRSLERLLLACYRPGDGLAHDDGVNPVRGLLADHVAVAAAALDAFDVSGNIVYEMMAEELMRYALRTMWDDVRGAFVDRVPVAVGEAVGRLARRVTPFAANADASRLLRRLAGTAGEPDFASAADRILAVTGALAPAQGAEAAQHELARRAAESR
jgi:uncharacterized protein YyaL (SSP411 family)